MPGRLPDEERRPPLPPEGGLAGGRPPSFPAYGPSTHPPRWETGRCLAHMSCCPPQFPQISSYLDMVLGREEYTKGR